MTPPGVPAVSVVIPVYNHERYIYECVDSVLIQNPAPPFEVLVVDDGSNDRTQEVLRAFGGRIRVIRQNRKGAASALNRGFLAAQGTYVCWLSSDDRFEPGKLEAQWRYMSARPSLALSYTSFHVIDRYGIRTYTVQAPYEPDRARLYAMLMNNCFINGSTIMMRRDIFVSLGGFDPDLAQGHDYDLWLRTLERYDVGYLPEPYVSYRWHGQNMSANPAADRMFSSLVRQRAQLRQRLQQRGGPG
ncbi:MAG: glycosyltransferase [Alicyclobacillaceae bacterium]|nr:glycosyltransferase [Alicyclobacillaceae bacterium]